MCLEYSVLLPAPPCCCVECSGSVVRSWEGYCLLYHPVLFRRSHERNLCFCGIMETTSINPLDLTILDTSCEVEYLSEVFVLCDWLMSLSIISSSFVHPQKLQDFRLLEKTCIPLLYTSHFLCPFTHGGQLHCFCTLTIVNSAVMNVGVQVSLWDLDFHSFR